MQIAAVAGRAGIAAGTVYRYFPAKTDLVAALLTFFALDPALWLDPVEGWILILLTNRVHPRYRPDDMNAVRRHFHRLALGAK